MNVLNKIKSKQAKLQQKEKGNQSLQKSNNLQSNDPEKNKLVNQHQQKRQNVDKSSSVSERANYKQNVKDKSVKKILNKVKLKITKQENQNDESKRQQEKSKLSKSVEKQSNEGKEQKQKKNNHQSKNNLQSFQSKFNVQKNQSQFIQRKSKQKSSKISRNTEHANKNANNNNKPSKQKIDNQFPNVYCQSLRRYSQQPSETNTDIFDDIPQAPHNNIKKIVQISSKHTRNTLERNQKQKQFAKVDSKLESFDRDSQGTGSFSFSYKPLPIKNQQMPKNYNYLLFVKKGFQIGRMSVFQGFLQQKKENKQLNLRIKFIQADHTKLSCKNQLIQNPQSISHIFMKKILEIGEKQYLVGSQDIIKAIEKPSNRR